MLTHFIFDEVFEKTNFHYGIFIILELKNLLRRETYLELISGKGNKLISLLVARFREDKCTLEEQIRIF